MRLINVKTMLLEEFFGDQIPSYAILSHTWGQNHEEVHFSEIGTASARHKIGYKKIQHLRWQAAKDGLHWAWCDTCCIDKSSSADLSESINSMFQWYHSAQVCYVYLSDVSGAKGEQNMINQMKRSRWFTRGWTLQELLAPKTVNFYDRNWNFLGDKSYLVQYLGEITGINFGALSWPWTLPSYSIATRMYWASNRATTRTEDLAYCMLGILGVHMPLLYGEGQNSFRRLQEELIKISDDETIFAHSGPNVLAKSPQEFSSAHNLTILRKDVSAPYSITNAGLRIHMRVLDLEVDAGSTHNQQISALGILNCHDNTEKIRNEYLALPLEITGINNTYRRAFSSPQWVDINRATAADYRTIFIQLKPVQISRITLLEEYDLSQYSSQAYPPKSPFVYNKEKREIRIYPTPPFEYEAVFHMFHKISGGDSQPFGVITFFELGIDRAGVLILPSSSYNLNDGQKLDWDGTFKTWKNQGRPNHSDLNVSSQEAGSGATIKVMVVQKEQMNQFVWFLRIENSNG